MFYALNCIAPSHLQGCTLLTLLMLQVFKPSKALRRCEHYIFEAVGSKQPWPFLKLSKYCLQNISFAMHGV